MGHGQCQTWIKVQHKAGDSTVQSRVGLFIKVNWSNLLCVCVCVCVRERERSRTENATYLAIKTAQLTRQPGLKSRGDSRERPTPCL